MDTFSSKDLEEQRRRKRERYIIVIVGVLVVFLTFLEAYLSGLKGQTFTVLPKSILVYGLININIILLLLLIFLVVRNIVKLFFERRKGILGSKLRTKLVIAFVALSLFPTILLFWVSIGFITNTIENWFSLEVENSLAQSLKVAQVYYKNSASNALYYAKQISQKIMEKRLPNLI